MFSPVLLLLASLTSLALTLDSDHSNADQHKKFCTWKCLKFTLQWPGSFCVGLNNSTKCKIPTSIQNWTIHGLWPSHVQDCCECWPIFHSDLKELDPELSQFWPSLLKAQSSFNFWKDEWIKHGSCAGCVEGMNSPLRYFQICLKLRKKFDIDRALNDDAGIKPSCNQSYQYKEIKHALAPITGDDPDAQIQCITDSKGREILFQVKIPLSRNLTFGCHDGRQDAESESTQHWNTYSAHPCQLKSSIFYFPINYNNPHQPCG
ncbi:hypothetical protein UPYG_G00195250 [Umbra pygmaea]|uniref:Uncharacterized protein n=1 Tax=Umbra pygmaea TaxID=75934 RepID=A0ABD0X4W4_UMBPY